MSGDLLSPFDDYPIHQTPHPVSVPGATDRNVYGRYWLGAGHRDGDFHIEMAFGRYPNLRVVDGHVSIVHDGHQSSFHASGEAPLDPTDTSVGPMRLEIVEPLRQLRVVVDSNDTGIACDLSYHSRTGALLEDHTTMTDGPNTMMDMARFVQFGTWEGTVEIDGSSLDVRRTEVFGIRDRSWGMRPVGSQPAGRPSGRSPIAWLWAPLHFEDRCQVAGWFELPGGMKWRPDGHVLPVTDPVPTSVAMGDPGVERLDPQVARLSFAEGTRWVTLAEIDVISDGTTQTIEVEPLLRFDMLGIGYQHPTWAHGVWHGEAVTAREEWKMADVEPLDPAHQHVHHVVKASMDGAEGYGIFEQIIHGPHSQWGFQDMLDGAGGTASD